MCLFYIFCYTKEDTDVLKGEEGRELSQRNYGPEEWWLPLGSVLDPIH